MAELEYIEIGRKENCILRKVTLKFANLIFVEKIILKRTYVRKYSQNLCSRSILKCPIRF